MTRPLPTARVERLTEKQAHRRETIKRMLLRYQEEKHLDAVPDDILLDDARMFDEHFTYARIPTDRIPEVYFEAMARHGQYLLKVNDYLAAWARLQERETLGEDVDARRRKPERPRCSVCKGSGQALRAVPKPGVPIWKDCDEVMAECVFCVPVRTELAVA